MEIAGGLHVVEGHVTTAVLWIRLCVESMGVIVISLGVVIAISHFALALLRGATQDYSDIRLILARYLVVGLELQLGADILSTAVAPSWDQIGKLGAIAIIRTGLNYFLGKEMESRALNRRPANS